MANTKISALPAAATITGTEVLPLVQDGATVAASVQQLLALIVAGAPGNLDTFFETATQLGLDETTVTTLQALVASKADAATVSATYVTFDGTNLRLNGVIIPITGGGNAVTFVDNGDGTVTYSGTGTVDNGDGTFTLTGSNVTDNGDGTFAVAA